MQERPGFLCVLGALCGQLQRSGRSARCAFVLGEPDARAPADPPSSRTTRRLTPRRPVVPFFTQQPVNIIT